MARIVKITAAVVLLVLCGSAWGLDANDPNLLAHWKFDEGSGTIAYDSASSNDGTLVNGPVWTSGKIDGGLEFDGVDDYVNCGSSFASVSGSTTKTIMAWAKSDTVDYSGQHGENGRVLTLYRSPGNSAFSIVPKGNPVSWQFIYRRSPDNVGWLDSGVNVSAGQWLHIALVQNGSNVSCYINGAEANSVNDGIPPAISNPTNADIGCYWNGYGSFFDGVIDDVRIYERALSAEEIEELYLMEISTHERAIMKLENASDKKQAALETIEEALDEEGDAYAALEEMLESKDYGDLNKRDIIRAKQEIHSAMQRQEQAAGALDRSIEGLYDALTGLGWEPTDPNLIAHWKLDEETGIIAYDSAGSNHGTLVNGPVWTTGQIDGGLDFDGSNDYVNSGNAFPSVAGSTTKTIMAWAKSDTADYSGQQGESGRIVTLYREPGNTAFSILAKGNPATWQSIYRRSPDDVGRLDSEVTVTADQWLHIALVQNDSNVSYYINGAEANSVNDGIAPAISNPTNADIGCYWNGYGAFFDGTIDDVRIYDKALSAEEILQLYEDGL